MGNFSTNRTRTVIHLGSAGLGFAVVVLRSGIELQRIRHHGLHHLGKAGDARRIGAGVIEEDPVTDLGRHQVVAGLIVPDPVPDSLAVSLEMVYPVFRGSDL